MLLKDTTTTSLESMVKWAVKNDATSIFVACINKIQKQSEAKGINPVPVLAFAAASSNFGKFDSMCNESYCNLFKKIKENDDIISVQRYKNWDDGILEFLAIYESYVALNNISEIYDIISKFGILGGCNIETIEKYINEISNTHSEPTTIHIPVNNDNMKQEMVNLNEQIIKLQEELEEKDNKIVDLLKSNEDMKEEIKLVEAFKESLKDFLK